MRLSPVDESDVITDEYFFQKYISRVSSGSSPYLTIKYYTKSVTDKVPYLPTDNGESRIITKVKIEGTTDLIVRLFVKYWNYNFEAGGRKSGAIANYQIMGDNIILKSTDRINISKIVIGEGAIKGFDYYSTFKIQN